MPILIDALIKTTILLVLVTAATHLLRRRSAALRHLLWSFAIVGLVMIPVLKRVAPEWRVLPATPSLTLSAAPATTPTPPNTETVRPPSSPVAASQAAAEPTRDLAAQVTAASAWSAWSAIAVIWLAGALILLARLAVGLITVQRIANRAKEVTDQNWRMVSDRSIRALDVRLPVEIRTSTEVAMPFACGVVRPVIVLPADADSWTSQQKDAVMLHELAHISRGDLAMNILSHVVRAVYWLNPLVWLASYRLRVEGERAADDAVLRGGARPSEYADHLLSIVRTVGPTVPNVALAMARRSDFEGRLLAILEPGLSRARLTRVRAAGLAALFLAAVTPLAAMTRADEVLQTLNVELQTSNIELQTASNETPAPIKREPLPQASGAVGALGEALTDENPSVRLAAVNSLGALQDPAAIAALARALKEDTDARVREAAAWALGEIDDNRAVPHLVDALRTEKTAKVKEKIVNALREIDDPSAVAGVIGAVRDPSAEVRRAVAAALAEFDEPTAYSALMGMARDDDVQVRREVAQHIGESEASGAFETLVTMSTDADDEVRANAIEGMHHFENDQRVVLHLVRALKDKSPHVRQHAADGLSNVHELIKTAPTALIEALSDTDRDVRRAAVNALGQIGDESAVPALKRLTADNDVETRRHAVEALKEIGGPEAIQALMGLLRDPDPEVRKTAAEALGRKRGG
jgi:HEAT repeat protein/beta-lactamase regulating signal transducer with metallopeptidase domain